MDDNPLKKHNIHNVNFIDLDQREEYFKYIFVYIEDLQ